MFIFGDDGVSVTWLLALDDSENVLAYLGKFYIVGTTGPTTTSSAAIRQDAVVVMDTASSFVNPATPFGE